jgi:hypothetical protein
MDKNNILWIDDLNLLFNDSKYMNFFPQKSETLNEQINSAVRFCIYAIVLCIIFGNQKKIPILLITAITTLTLYGKEKNKLNEDDQPADDYEEVNEDDQSEVDDIKGSNHGSNQSIYGSNQSIYGSNQSIYGNNQFNPSNSQSDSQSNTNWDYAYDTTSNAPINISNFDTTTNTNAYDPKFFQDVNDMLSLREDEIKSSIMPFDPDAQSKLAKQLYDLPQTNKEKSIEQMWAF